MKPRLILNRRVGVGIVFAMLAAIAFFPLRLALDGAGLSGAKGGDGINARQVRGSIWSGQIYDAMLGELHIGDVTVGLSPLDLAMARLRLDIRREGGVMGDLRGAWIKGFNQNGVADVTGVIAASDIFGALPVSGLEMDGVTAVFSGALCARASGKLRLRLNGDIAGIALSQGLSGAAVCDGDAVQFPLASQTGLEGLTLRVRRDGSYDAQVLVRGGRDMNVAALQASGFSPRGEDYVLSLKGRM